MGLNETIKAIGSHIASVLNFLISDEDKDGIPLVIEWALVAVKLIGMFNPVSLTDSEKQVAGRVLVEFAKHVTVEELERLIEIKKTGAFKVISSPMLDMVVGNATAIYLVEKKARRTGKTA